MPPHCDTMDGPVVQAAKKALKTANANLILPWVPSAAEAELRKAFRKTLNVRKLGRQAAGLADIWFYETAVRLHREGEGAPYTGLKPAGLDWGPVVRKAENAIEKGDAGKVIEFLLHTVNETLRSRFDKAISMKGYDENDIEAARHYVHAMLGFVLFSHELYEFVKSERGHEEARATGHEH